VRLAATDLRSVGEKAGALYAVSTLGSFLGCLVTSFYLILWLGMNRILRIHAALLVLAALGFWLLWRRLTARIQCAAPVAARDGAALFRKPPPPEPAAADADGRR